jgi:hypothetical protein
MQSQYPPNVTWPWCPMDTQERYLQNRARQPDQLRKHGWWDHEPIEYRFNSAGFRADEFDSGPGTLFLGCSFTLGIGISHKHTWAHKVSQGLGTACWNLGQGGASMDTCFRLAEHWIPRLRPQRVVLMITLAARLEWIDAEGIPRPYTPQDASTGAREWLAHPENARLAHIKNKLAIARLCDQHEIALHEWDHTDLPSKCSLARDLAHPGIECNHAFAERVLMQIRPAFSSNGSA